MKQIKPLLVILHCRAIPYVLENIKDLTIDKLWINFYEQTDAYRIAREEFLKNEQYTHFFLHSDDLVVYNWNVLQLIKVVTKYPHFRVISGWCNLDLEDHDHLTNFSFSLPPDPPCEGIVEQYNFEPIAPYESMSVVGKTIQVMHQGTALTSLSREILERIPFRDSKGCCIDSCLSLDLHKNKIPQFVDLDNRMLHLKISDQQSFKILLNGKYAPHVTFQEWQTKATIPIQFG